MPTAPDYVRRNAQRGLRLLEYAGDGLQDSTVRAARRMAEGTVSDQKARLMGPWFARHEGDLDSPRARAYLAGDSDRPTAGQVAWLLWGGDISGDVMRAARWARRQTETDDRSTPTGVIDSPETHVAPLEAPPASYGHPASTRHSTPTKKGATVRLLDQLVEERAELSETVDGILTRAADEARDLSEAEDKNLADLKARADALDERITELRAIQVKNLEAAKLRAEVAATEEPEARSAAGVVQVHSEPVTYHERGDHSFFADLVAAQSRNDIAARQRLERHMQEVAVENRDGTTANVSGLVPPAYLIDLAVAKSQGGRPTANAVRNLPLTESGMTVNLSRVTTSSSAAVQQEGGAVSETTVDDTLMTADVVTIAGMQDFSAQALARGIGVDQLLIEDLTMSYATALDSNIINGDGTGGASTGILNAAGTGSVTYTDASPSGAETWQQVVKAISTVQSSKFLSPDVVVMHPRRAAFIAGSLDSSNRPLMQPVVATASNVLGTGELSYGAPTMSIAGLPVVTDSNIPTNLGTGTDEDAIIVMRSDDVILWEENGGSPLVVQYDSVGSGTLTVRIVAYGYSAFLVRDPNSVAVITGTGLNATL